VVSRHFWGTYGLWNLAAFTELCGIISHKIELFIVPTVRISNTLAMTVEVWEIFQSRKCYSKFIVPDNILDRYNNIIRKVSEIISDHKGIDKLQNRNSFHLLCKNSSFHSGVVNASDLWVNMCNSRNTAEYHSFEFILFMLFQFYVAIFLCLSGLLAFVDFIISHMLDRHLISH
jgi:hypothetical protein